MSVRKELPDVIHREEELSEFVELVFQHAKIMGWYLIERNGKQAFEKCDRYLASVYEGMVIGIVTNSATGFDGKALPIDDTLVVLTPYPNLGLLSDFLQ